MGSRAGAAGGRAGGRERCASHLGREIESAARGGRCHFTAGLSEVSVVLLPCVWYLLLVEEGEVSGLLFVT